MENSQSMKVIFNYDDIFFSFIYDDEGLCVHRAKDYALNYVYSGEMVIENGEEIIKVMKGECVFIPRNHHLRMYKKSSNGEQYCGIYMNFTRRFLRDVYMKNCRYRELQNLKRSEPKVIKLPQTAEISSIFASMTPYFNQEVKPQDDFMNLKLQEGLVALLHINPQFATMLFDFSEPWKIDIIDFLNKNYMYEFSMEELARYTGRSLATFKRDFKKVSTLSPEKWLMRKRLDEAYKMLLEGKKRIVDIYSEVGFKNPSHFSSAFKKQYGVPPTSLTE